MGRERFPEVCERARHAPRRRRHRPASFGTDGGLTRRPKRRHVDKHRRHTEPVGVISHEVAHEPSGIHAGLRGPSRFRHGPHESIDVDTRRALALATRDDRLTLGLKPGVVGNAGTYLVHRHALGGDGLPSAGLTQAHHRIRAMLSHRSAQGRGGEHHRKLHPDELRAGLAPLGQERPHRLPRRVLRVAAEGFEGGHQNAHTTTLPAYTAPSGHMAVTFH